MVSEHVTLCLGASSQAYRNPAALAHHGSRATLHGSRTALHCSRATLHCARTVPLASLSIGVAWRSLAAVHWGLCGGWFSF